MHITLALILAVAWMMMGLVIFVTNKRYNMVCGWIMFNVGFVILVILATFVRFFEGL